MDENISYGNFGAYFLIILEQFFINGIWGGWGQLCVHFKENNYFEDEFCEKFSNGTQNCDKRYFFFPEGLVSFQHNFSSETAFSMMSTRYLV